MLIGVAAILLLATFVWNEARCRHPLMNVSGDSISQCEDDLRDVDYRYGH